MTTSPAEMLNEVLDLRDQVNAAVEKFLESVPVARRPQAANRMAALLVIPQTDKLAKTIKDELLGAKKNCGCGCQENS